MKSRDGFCEYMSNTSGIGVGRRRRDAIDDAEVPSRRGVSVVF